LPSWLAVAAIHDILKSRGFNMNVHQIDGKKLLDHLHAIEEKFPLHFVGLLPRGTAAHVFDEDAIDLLAERREGLSLLSLAGAEIELGERLGRQVGIVLVGGLRGERGERVKASARPL
jgi:predicted nucleotidyltransferase